MNKSNHIALGYKYSIRDKHHIDSPPYFLPVYYRPQDQANWSVVGDDCRIPWSIFHQLAMICMAFRLGNKNRPVVFGSVCLKEVFMDAHPRYYHVGNIYLR